VKEERQM